MTLPFKNANELGEYLGKLEERVKKYNPDAQNIRPFHALRPIPQTHIDRLSPRGPIEEEQNIGYY